MDIVKQEEEEQKATPAAVAVVDWLELPEHLTSHILSKLSSITDFACFGGVCVKWKSILFQEDFNKLLPRQLPLLMVPTTPSLHPSQEPKKKKQKKKKKRKNNMKADSCSFYRVTDGKLFNQLRLTMPPHRYVRGSGHGWLITVDVDFSIQLMNPFFYPNSSTKEIKLPPLTAHPYHMDKDPSDVYYFVFWKAILSADPISNPNDWIVMAIITSFSTLAFCKSGDKVWTPITNDICTVFDDITYYEDKFYAVHRGGNILVCDIENCTTTTYAGPPVTDFESNKKYLIAVNGEFWQVQRDFNNSDDICRTEEFKVFKLLKGEPDTEWVEMYDLDNHAFFLGDNASMSISAADFPGCKPNCIYFTHDYIASFMVIHPDSRPDDLGVFNLKDGSFEKHYPTDDDIILFPPPIWIEPTLPRFITSSK